jgi:hypothetical protein
MAVVEIVCKNCLRSFWIILIHFKILTDPYVGGHKGLVFINCDERRKPFERYSRKAFVLFYYRKNIMEKSRMDLYIQVLQYL